MDTTNTEGTMCPTCNVAMENGACPKCGATAESATPTAPAEGEAPAAPQE